MGFLKLKLKAKFNIQDYKFNTVISFYGAFFADVQVCILLIKISAAQNGVALSYHSARAIFSGSYFCEEYSLLRVQWIL